MRLATTSVRPLERLGAADRTLSAVTTPALASTRADLVDALAEADEVSAVVMTMGALHEGHRRLIEAARTLVGETGTVIVTIFVNPLQFGPGEDFERYPRTPEADLAVCADEGVDVVFSPSRAEMYPDGVPQVRIDPGPLARELEGVARPTHFAGVLTVVAKLLNLTVPTYAVFGEKDYQQLALVRRMIDDLDLPHEIVGVPTVREDDGLAMSSRNRYMSAEQRELALVLSRALSRGRDASGDGPRAVLDAARALLTGAPAVDVDYLELRGADLGADPRHGEARLLVAGRVGGTRLIDNMAVHLP